ncbi:hypothetical protein QBC46DRAFT_462302 [Diplogelasinospora grovesii]|uniref:Probable quinone oxidoreductase n=1 Tax=Diplogelasinospora grovesii TaxID=303347 RepID=A0AAN6S097_9PEZI|nr:hypothetical protein QBC46DRAFT_462302 [Diplogelasinospora grovesii]
MSGVILEEFGDASKLQWRTDVPIPTLSEGGILVRNDYAGVNFLDTHFRDGRYKTPLPFPLILGGEAAGTVVAVHPSVAAMGDLSFKPGDRVAYMSMGGGAYAQYAAVSVAAAVVLRLPDDISSAVGAAILAQGLTALALMRESHQVRAGQWVLVHTAAGGTGSLLVQMCAAVAGARVIGVVSTAGKAEAARQHGAEFVIDTSAEPDWVKRVVEITGGYGVDAVFDAVGKTTFDGNLEVAARRGTLVCFGNASGPVPPFDIMRLGGEKNLKLCRPTLFAYIATQQEVSKYAAELFQLVRSGKAKVDTHVYELKDVARAHEDIESRRSQGKLLLKMP